MNNFAVLDIEYAHTADSVIITIPTNNPCHLLCFYTFKKPLQHHTQRTIRGLAVPWGTYFCFVAWHRVEQIEPGDTLTHTFIIPGLVYCQTVWFTFRGTVGGVLSPSVGPIFSHHFVPWLTLVLPAVKDTWNNTTSKSANYGLSTSARVINSLPAMSDAHMFVAFDPSAIPGGATILSATLRLAFFASSSEGNTHWAYRFIPTTWVETELTYRRSSVGVPWLVDALFSEADFETIDPPGAWAFIPPLTGTSATEWDVLEIVKDAIEAPTNVNIVITGQYPETGAVFYDTREAFFAQDRPKLTIVYTEKH